VVSKARKLDLTRALPILSISISVFVGVLLAILLPILYLYLGIPLYVNPTYVLSMPFLTPLAAFALLVPIAYSELYRARKLAQRLKLVCKGYLEL